MAINLAEKYSSKLDLIYTHGSYTANFVNSDYDFDGVDTIHVLTTTSVVPGDYNRTLEGDRYGGAKEVQDTMATYQLTKDKAFKLAIDRGNLEQQARAKRAGKIMKQEMDEQITPMFDKDRLAVAGAAAEAAGQNISATADAYVDVLKANEYLDEIQAPVDGRALFVTPAFYNAIKGQIVTTMFANGYNEKLVKRGFVGELDGVPVIKVPTKLMPASTKALLWHKSALLGAKQIMETRIKTDSEMVSGALLLGRFIFGNFALKAKEKAFASIVDAA